jgi:hypothetical protein
MESLLPRFLGFAELMIGDFVGSNISSSHRDTERPSMKQLLCCFFMMAEFITLKNSFQSLNPQVG